MKYMLLIYGNQDTWDALTRDGMDAVMARHHRLQDEMTAAGELIATQALTTEGARVVRPGVDAVTDGPFTEAKEVLAGYYLVECGLERATELAKQLPEAAYSPIEVRTVVDA